MQPFIPDPATRVQQILSNSVDKSSSSSSTSTTTTTRNEPRRSRSPERLKRDPPDAKQARKWCEVEAPEPEPVLKEGDRVVWLQDGAQHGVVKFVGKLKRSGNQLMAGIAMVSCSNSCKVFFWHFWESFRLLCCFSLRCECLMSTATLNTWYATEVKRPCYKCLKIVTLSSCSTDENIWYIPCIEWIHRKKRVPGSGTRSLDLSIQVLSWIPIQRLFFEWNECQIFHLNFFVSCDAWTYANNSTLSWH